MKEIKYVQPTKHPQYLYIRAQTKTICIIQTHTQGPFYPPYKIRGWGGSKHVNVCSTCPARHTTTVCVYSGTDRTICILRTNTQDPVYYPKHDSGVGENSAPRGYRHGNPIGIPLEALRNTTGTPWESYAIPLPHGAPEVPNWESHKHPMGVPMESP